ncbi:helix-turn-helix domain-containing protein [Aquimarina sp. 2201CG14-23]|uniref:helix-turn-helix domain-containing protein n=1 Tax=Aquimarina mycalae TaxID=3040073 RepID=UPI0024780EFA|nr:AraC family transcriptional regulator [Aquimarina sp. 2201CG14-23]MDH7447486.1 AraC family transcriptional regulator [Aquimarina sp. 2201CG14-23]
MLSFEFIDLILFLGISQGIFLAITIQVIQNKNKPANKILSIILLISVLMLIGRMIFLKYLTISLFLYTILIDSVIFIFGPLCNIYIRRLTLYEVKNYELPWFHYIPLVLHLFFFVYIASFSSEMFAKKVTDGDFNIHFIIIEGAGIVSNLVYWFLNVKLLQKYVRAEKQNVSFSQNLVTFLKYFYVSVGIFLGLWVISFISAKFFDHSLYPIGYDWLWVGISVFIFVVGYYSLKEPELFRIPLSNEKQKIKRLPESEIFSIGNQLKHLMEKEKIFLKSDLTLRELSEKLDTSTHNISWFLNNIVKSSFYDYVNHYRIKEFLQKVAQGAHLQHTILAISMEVGFNSKSTFNKAFKLEMKETPSNYIKREKVA